MTTGRRFSEILTLPYQELQVDDNGEEFLEYFPKKTSPGNVSTPKERLYLPDQSLEIVRDVFYEIKLLCAPARDTAKYMYENQGVDLRFLSDVPDDKKLYSEDLIQLNISHRVMAITGWIRKNNFTKPDFNKKTKQGRLPANPIRYTWKDGVEKYCKYNYKGNPRSVIYIDQEGKKYFLKDLMLVRYAGLSSGYYMHWISTQCTHAMFTTNLRYFDNLCEEFSPKKLTEKFTSHDFRHTLNTLLDEGGLSDVMQTEWFGRTNPNDTKAYQHTSREKRALMIREDIKNGTIKGALAEEIKMFPISQQDAILKARVKASQDVGPGICIHDFSQVPCERQLSCSADCKDYIWVENDEGRLDELKRKYSVTFLAREVSLQKTNSLKPKKSVDWLAHNDKELKTLSEQHENNGIDLTTFNSEDYLKKYNQESKHG